MCIVYNLDLRHMYMPRALNIYTILCGCEFGLATVHTLVSFICVYAKFMLVIRSFVTSFITLVPLKACCYKELGRK